jgi:hypothetical protein
VPGLNALAATPYSDGSTFADLVHFVHVYVIEAHPMDPALSPYSGTVWEVEYSTVPEALTYEARLANAALTRPLVQGNQIFLVDALDRERLINPVWCTYGTAPNSTYVIGQDGTIVLASRWTDVAEIEPALRALLAAGG